MLLILFISGYLILGVAALFGMVVQPSAQARPVEPPLSEADQRILDQVAELLGSNKPIQVQQAPDGTHFVDSDGSFRAVLLTQLAPDGTAVLRCVTTLEEARAFLSGSDPATAALLAGRAIATTDRPAPETRATPAAASQIMIVNLDDPGTGFNDPTPATPIGGNGGTTVGEQRLIAFEYAAAIWADSLQTTIPIRIGASFQPRPCSSNSGVLGSAGPTIEFRNFSGSGLAPGALRANTWYPSALANKLAGRDLSPPSLDPLDPDYDILAIFNSALGQPGCLETSFWYYGLDGQFVAGGIDLVTVLLHEFAHGLGFLSYVGTQSPIFGENYPPFEASASDDIWNYFLFDGTLNRYWREMTPLQRSFSMTNTGLLVWDGPEVNAVTPTTLRSTPVFTITNPPALAGTYALGEATFGPDAPNSPLSASISAGIDPADQNGISTTDGCSPLTNSEAVSGTIVVLDLYECDDAVKARNAQDAGALGVLLAETVNSPDPPELFGDDPTISIPVFGITKALADQLRTAIGDSGANGALGRDLSTLVGADSSGRVRMYAPNGIRPGSSVSHFDIAAVPNLLMEPAINIDLDQSLDLTDELMRDIGWFPDKNFNTVDDRNEIKLSVSQEITPTGRLENGDVVTFTITVQNDGALGSDGVWLSSLFPTGLISVTWNADYSAGASGPSAGTGDIDSVLSLGADSQAVFVVTAEIATTGLGDLINIVRISTIGTELDGDLSDNEASVIILVSSYRVLLPTLEFVPVPE
ncbi:MAG: hypothetical protein HC822_18435 [Oscillochloris sp.]|nr:hypothetical protein [Oscillochloris sp.]